MSDRTRPPQPEIEDKVLDAVSRWQGTEKYPEGLTANEIGRFVWGVGAGEVKYFADQLAGAGVLVKHKPGRAERYCMPEPEPNRRGVEGGKTSKNLYDS